MSIPLRQSARIAHYLLKQKVKRTDKYPLLVELEPAAGRSVDLVVLGTAPPLLAHEIISHGTLLVCRDQDERVRFEVRTLMRYLDTAHLRKVQYAYLRERAESRHARSG